MTMAIVRAAAVMIRVVVVVLLFMDAITFIKALVTMAIVGATAVMVGMPQITVIRCGISITAIGKYQYRNKHDNRNYLQ